MLEELLQIESEYASREGIQMQVELVTDLMNGEGISKDIIDGHPIVKTVIDKAVKEYRKAGIEEKVLEDISNGNICELSGNSKRVIIDLVLNSLESLGYSLFQDGKLLPDKLKKGNVDSLYDDFRVLMVANLIQISSPDTQGYREMKQVLGISETGGVSFPIIGVKRNNTKITIEEKGQMILVNIIDDIKDKKTNRIPFEEIRRHELWHAFDGIRYSFLSKSSQQLVESTSVERAKEFSEALSILEKDISSNTAVGMLMNLNLLPNISALGSGLLLLLVELPAHLAGKIRNVDLNILSTQIDEDQIVEKLIGMYLLNGCINIPRLRKYSNISEGGKVEFSSVKLLEAVNDPRSFTSGEFGGDAYWAFIEYFTEQKQGLFGLRTYKPGKEDELLGICQRMVDLIYNDKTSPIVKISTDLREAIRAFKERARKVSPYQVLVEMSLLPYKRWPAFVRLKNSGMKFPNSKDSLQ